MSNYPQNLIPVLIKICEARKNSKYSKPPKLPSEHELEILLDTAFHATFQKEEGRTPRFRLIYLPKEFPQNPDEKKINRIGHDFRILRFDKQRNYSVSEINRLAPVAELTRLLICIDNYAIDKSQSDLRIWGMLDVGENWWKFIHHEVSGGMPPPNYLTISSIEPGEITLSSQGFVFCTLKNGMILQPSGNPLWEGPVCDFLENARKQLYKETISILKTKRWDEEGSDDDYPYRFYNYFFESILFYMREKHHGGTVIIIPTYLTKDDTRITDRMIIKYPSSYDYAWDFLKRSLVNHQQYYALQFPLWDGKIAMTVDNYRKCERLSDEMEEIEEALVDIAQAIASLASVDGVVLINDKFSVLGFGAEVTAISPSLTEVVIGETKSKVSVESYGTRHRSAFRFCSSLEDSVAFVVSQDGGVKAIKRVGKDIVMWPDINTGEMGI